MDELLELQRRLDELDASITVLERIEHPSDRAQADLEARRARRAELAEALALLRDRGSR